MCNAQQSEYTKSKVASGTEEEELQQDAAALAGEFREVRKLRRLLAAARQEAQEALADTKPSQPTAETGAACSQCWRLQQQLSTLQVGHQWCIHASSPYKDRSLQWFK